MRPEDTTLGPNPSGLCMCGCGQTTPLATKTNARKGLVRGHHSRFVPGHTSRQPLNLADRFWAKVAVSGDDECWEWLAAKYRTGYGQFKVGGKHGLGVGAHRIAYELVIGPIPGDLEIDHLCRNRGCVNPAHLEAVTRQVNVVRGASFAAENAAKTHCVQGHPFSGSNLRIGTSGRRCCKACDADAARRYLERQRDTT